jgi:hypothetical protein
MVKAIKKKTTKAPQKGDSGFLGDFLSGAVDRFDDLTPSSKEILSAAGRCLGAVRDGAAKLYKPLAIRREGKARVDVEAYKIEKLAEAEAKASLIKADSSAKQTLAEAELQDELARRMKAKVVNQELFRQANIEAILAESIQIAETEDHGEALPIDESWMWKFIENAQNISDEGLRSYWAHMLNSQAKEGNIKPNVLDTLRLFDSEIASSFENISTLTHLYQYIIPDRFEAYPAVSEEEVDTLLDIGILKLVSTDFWDNFKLGSALQLSAGDKTSSINVFPMTHIYELTSTGKTLCSIIFQHKFTSRRGLRDRERLLGYIGTGHCSLYINNIVIAFARSRGTGTVKLSSPIDLRVERELDAEKLFKLSGSPSNVLIEIQMDIDHNGEMILEIIRYSGELLIKIPDVIGSKGKRLSLYGEPPPFIFKDMLAFIDSLDRYDPATDNA